MKSILKKVLAINAAFLLSCGVCISKPSAIPVPLARYQEKVPLCTRSEPVGVSLDLSKVADRWYRAIGTPWVVGNNVSWAETSLYRPYVGYFIANNDTHCTLLIHHTATSPKENILMHEYGHALAGTGHPKKSNVMTHEGGGSCITQEDLDWVCSRRQCKWMKPECKGDKK